MVPLVRAPPARREAGRLFAGVRAEAGRADGAYGAVFYFRRRCVLRMRAWTVYLELFER